MIVKHIIIVAILLFLLIVASLLERFLFNVNPIIWLVGLIAGGVFGVMGKGMVAIMESCIALVVTFVVILILYIFTKGAIGGAVFKGLCMCSFFVGRYILIDFLLFVIFSAILAKIFAKRNKDVLPGQNLTNGIMVLLISTIVTIGTMYILNVI